MREMKQILQRSLGMSCDVITSKQPEPTHSSNPAQLDPPNQKLNQIEAAKKQRNVPTTQPNLKYEVTKKTHPTRLRTNICPDDPFQPTRLT